MSETDSAGIEVAKYLFAPDASACDICESMAGEYEDAPSVPVHPHCECTLTRLGGPEDDCTYEIIDLVWEEEFYDETRTIRSIVFDAPLEADTEISEEVLYGTEHYDFDDGVRNAAEELGWRDEQHTALISQTVPAGTTSVDIEVNFRMSSSTFRGERRQACTTNNADGSVTTTYEYLGGVEGTATESDVESFEIYPTSSSGGEGDFFEGGDEVPA
jgi:hypothetical protein